MRKRELRDQKATDIQTSSLKLRMFYLHTHAERDKIIVPQLKENI